MRSLKTLLEIVIDSLEQGDKKHYYNNGICGELKDLLRNGKIDTFEHPVVEDYIYENKPSKFKHKEFFTNDYWDGDMYWWQLMQVKPETRQIRINFLTKLKAEL